MWDRERDLLVTLTDYEDHVIGEIAEADMEYALADFPASLAVMEGSSRSSSASPTSTPIRRSGRCSRRAATARLLMLPLVSRGDTVGLLEIVDVADRVWSEHDLEFFRSLADIVGAAVHTALLNGAAARGREPLPQPGRAPARRHLRRRRRHRRSGLRQPAAADADGRARRGVDGAAPTAGCKRMHPDDLFAADRYRDAVRSRRAVLAPSTG